MKEPNIFDVISGNEFLFLSKTIITNFGIRPAYVFAIIKDISASHKHFGECPNVVVTKNVIEDLEMGAGNDWKDILDDFDKSGLIILATNEWGQIVIRWPSCNNCKNCSKGYKE